MIKLIKPYISFAEVEKEFREIFESGIFTRGKYVGALADSISAYTGARFTHLASSATTALSMALRVLKIAPGDEVICSDFSFPATANVIEDIGAIPIFADVRPDTFNMDVESLQQKITPRTKAVMFVDALGNPAGIHEIRDFCRSKQLPLIEDAACAIGSSENGNKVGAIADISCFSFHPRKLLTTGEGGAITTNNPAFDEILRIKLLHGAVATTEGMDFVDFGYNYRLPDLQCVMGIKQLQKLDTIVRERNEIRSKFIEQLSPLGFLVQAHSNTTVHNVQSLVFRMPHGTNRQALTNYLKNAGIESTLGTYSMSSTTYYAKKYKDIQPTSKLLQDTTITLPCYAGVPVDLICQEIGNWLKNAQ